MSARERLAEIVSTGRTAPMRVVHPEKGVILVDAYCAIDAGLFALAQWQLSFEEYKRMKVYLADHNPSDDGPLGAGRNR